MGPLVDDLLAEAEAVGLRISVDGDRLVVRGESRHEPVVQRISEAKDEILRHFAINRDSEIQRRIDAFQSQVPLTGPIPFLAMTSKFERGHCLSCGGPPDDKYQTRCELCAEAARRVIAEVDQRRRDRCKT